MVTAQEIGKEFGKLMNLYKRKFASLEANELKDQKENCSFTPKQGMIIGFISRQTKEGKDVYQKDIEKEFSLRRSTATGILQIMEKNDLIKREQLDSDARMKKIVLTTKAIQMNKDIVAGFDTVTNIAFDGVTQQELETIQKVIHKMQKNLEEK